MEVFYQKYTPEATQLKTRTPIDRWLQLQNFTHVTLEIVAVVILAD